MQSFADFQNAVQQLAQQLSQVQKQQFVLWSAQCLLEQTMYCEDVDENPEDIALLNSIFTKDLAHNNVSETGLTIAQQKLERVFNEERTDLEDTSGFALNVCEMLEIGFQEISTEDVLHVAELQIGLTDWLLSGTTNYSLENMFTFPEMQIHWQQIEQFFKRITRA